MGYALEILRLSGASRIRLKSRYVPIFDGQDVDRDTEDRRTVSGIEASFERGAFVRRWAYKGMPSAEQLSAAVRAAYDRWVAAGRPA